ncbi:MAG TPA: hypothetical protein VJJ81_01210 [Candidatus Babeliales bacterium]|nr:hypothetical protein [Candidatus Babeliales bacterium]
MKNLILFLMSCSAIANLAALDWDSPVSLPAREILKDRLCAAGFDHFEEKTKLSERLTDYTKVLGEVEIEVEKALDDYSKYLNNSILDRATRMRKSKLLETVLQDVPGAVAAIDKEMAEALREMAETLRECADRK